MNALALLSLKMEAVFGEDVPHQLQQQVNALREALHEEDESMIDIYEDIASYYKDVFKPECGTQEKSLSTFTDKYIEQVEVMLAGISSIRSRDFEGCLAALDRAVKYFEATDLFIYFKMIPLLGWPVF